MSKPTLEAKLTDQQPALGLFQGDGPENSEAVNDTPITPAESEPGAKIVTVQTFENVQKPDDSWTVDQLGRFAREQDEQVKANERRSAIHTYRTGQALILAKKKMKHGAWGAYLKRYGVSHATWTRARKLVENATEHQVLGMTITDAYITFGVLSKSDEHEDASAKSKRPTKGSTASRSKKPASRQGSAAKIAAGPSDDDYDQLTEKQIHTPDEESQREMANADRDEEIDGDEDELRNVLVTLKGFVANDPWKTLAKIIGLLDLNWSEVAKWTLRQAESEADAPERSVQTELNIDTTNDEFVKV